MSVRRVSAAALAAAAVALLAACGGGGESPQGITSIDQLQGRTIGVFDFDDTSTLSLRYLLQEQYGLDAAASDGDVTLVELPGADLLPQLADGQVDAAVVPAGRPFGVFDENQVRVLNHVTSEVRSLTGEDIANSVLLTYTDVADQKSDAIFELNRMLKASAAYAEVNRGDIIDEITAGEESAADVARSWWDVRTLQFGETSDQIQQEISGVWDMASTLGDIGAVPDLTELMPFQAAGEVPGKEVPENGDVGDRVNVSIGVLDDVSRRVALYAIEQAIVDSDLIDVSITYLSRSDLTDAVSSREVDVVEGSPLSVPLGAERNLDFVIVSVGEVNKDGTLLVVANE